MLFKKNRRTTTLIQWLALLLAIVAISVWLNRHLLQKGTTLDPLQLPNLQGEIQRIDWQDSRRTVVYAFAPWCSICRVSMPGLNIIEDNDVRVIALAFDWQSEQEVAQFVDNVGFQGHVLMANDSLAQTLKVEAYPTYYVIDQNGIIQHRDRGLTTPPGLWLRTRL